MPDLPFLDSFDHYLTADGIQKWSGWSTSITISAGNGRRGTAGARIEGTGVSKTFAAEYATLYMGGAFKGPGNSCFRLYNTLHDIDKLNGVNVAMTSVGDGRFQITGNDPTNGSLNPPQLWFGYTPPILDDRWYYLEMSAAVSASGISVTIRINEESVLTESVSFVGTLTSHIGWATFNIQGKSGGLFTMVDDVYVTTSGFYGDVDIDVIRPNGPSSSGWTPSPVVANWNNVKDITPDGDATTVASTAVNDLDLYTMEDIAVGSDVKAIQGLASVKKDTPGLASLELQYGSGSPLYSNEFYPSQDSYIMLRDGREDILVVADINALLFGPKRIK